MKCRVSSFHPALEYKIVVSFERGRRHTNSLVVFQSSAAALGSLPATVGRWSVSRCPGSATAGQRVTTRVTRWTVPVSIARGSPFVLQPAVLRNHPQQDWCLERNSYTSGRLDHSWADLYTGVNAQQIASRTRLAALDWRRQKADGRTVVYFSGCTCLCFC